MSNATEDQVIDRVFDQCVKNFDAIAEQQLHGTIDQWMLPQGVLLLNDRHVSLALVCRMMLRESGIVSRLMLCKTGTGYHIVVVAGKNQTLILDPALKTVKTKQQLSFLRGYKWRYASDVEPSGIWYPVEP